MTLHPLASGLGTGVVGAPIDLETVAVLEGSFALLAADGPRLVARFYELLFERAPSLRPLFPADLAAQRTKLLDALRLVLEGLRAPAGMHATLRELGRRHVDYGARPEHYPLVTSCLLEAMAEVAGSHWDVRTALEWSRALELVCRLMLEGAAGAR